MKTFLGNEKKTHELEVPVEKRFASRINLKILKILEVSYVIEQTLWKRYMYGK